MTTLFFDFDVGLGFSTAKLRDSVSLSPSVAIFDEEDPLAEETVESDDGYSFDSGMAFMVPFNFEVGLISMRRSYNLRGLGIFFRGGYRIEGNYAYTGSKSASSSQGAAEEKLELGYERMEIRHAPFVMLGSVF